MKFSVLFLMLICLISCKSLQTSTTSCSDDFIHLESTVTYHTDIEVKDYDEANGIITLTDGSKIDLKNIDNIKSYSIIDRKTTVIGESFIQ